MIVVVNEWHQVGLERSVLARRFYRDLRYAGLDRALRRSTEYQSLDIEPGRESDGRVCAGVGKQRWGAILPAEDAGAGAGGVAGSERGADDEFKQPSDVGGYERSKREVLSSAEIGDGA